VERLIATPETAEELVQDLFLRLWERRQAWTVRESVRAYLFAAARHHALNHLRRDRLRRRWHDLMGRSAPEGPDPAFPTPPPPPDRAVVARDEAARLGAALSRLPQRARLVVELRWLHQLSHREIAAVMGISVKGVENQLGRALRMLRDQLGA
jgi:RNA polymerase sigma-70 factor (ECF subfamily)